MTYKFRRKSALKIRNTKRLTSAWTQKPVIKIPKAIETRVRQKAERDLLNDVTIAELFELKQVALSLKTAKTPSYSHDNLVKNNPILAIRKVERDQLRNMTDLRRYMQRCAIQALAVKQLDHPKATTLSDTEIMYLVLNNTDLIYERVNVNGSEDVVYYIKDYQTLTYKPLVFELDKLLTNIALAIPVANITKLNTNVRQLITTVDPYLVGIPELRLPPQWVVKFKNGVMDLKTKVFVKDSSQYDKYHFVRFIPHDYIPLTETERTNMLNLHIIKRIFNDWGKAIPENVNYLKQNLFAVIDGNGRGKINIFKSDGGDGKSTYFDIARGIVGDFAALEIGLHQLDDDNLVNKLSLNVSVKIGDDSPTNAKVSPEALARLKTLLTGGSFMANVKFKDPTLVQSIAPFFIGTNSDYTFFENSSAVKARVSAYEWPNRNFRQFPVEDFNLSELVGRRGVPGNEAFYEAMISWIVDTVDYFDKFDVPSEITAKTNTMIEGKDPVFQTWNKLKVMGVNHFEKLPVVALFEFHKEEVKAENPSGGVLKQEQFVEQLIPIMERDGFTFDREAQPIYLTRLGKYAYDNELFCDIIGREIKLRKTSKYFHNKNNAITEADIKAFRKDVLLGKYSPMEIEMNLRYHLMMNALIKSGDIEMITFMS